MSDSPVVIREFFTGDIDQMEYLLEKKLISNVNITDDTQDTALMYATRFNEIDKMMFLLKYKGALSNININIKDNRGQTALHHAVDKIDDPTRIKLLIDFGADRDIRDINGQTALDKAREMTLRQCIDALNNYQPDSTSKLVSEEKVGGSRRRYKSRKSRKSKKSKKSKKSRKSRKSRRRRR